jgi:hypothetical protein
MHAFNAREPEVTEDPAGPSKGWRGLARAWFELAGVWALAIAWPVYQNIASGPEALTMLGARRLDLAIVIVIVSLLVPSLLTLIEWLVGRLVTVRAAEIFHATALGALIALMIWQLMTARSMAASLAVILPLLVWAAATTFYLRSEFARNFAVILGLATPVVIVAFCLSYPISFEVLPHESPSHDAGVDSDTPVVMVIFDEFPLAALEDSEGRIDSGLYPGFGDLAATSTWYPDMTAVADQTAVAVPAILTGETPGNRPGDEPVPPGIANYPDNLCSGAADGGYEVFSSERITDLCHRSWGLGTRVSELLKGGVATGDDLAPTGLETRAVDSFAQNFPTPYSELDADRDDAIDDFIANMPGKKRSVSVLHMTLPHVKWEYMPDGSNYIPEPLDRLVTMMPGSPGESTHFLQQMLLQLSFTDHKLTQIIDRMKAQGIWDESLFVVTADHGASFIPGSSRRALTEENLGWILPVPLFIKYPGQDSGEVVRGPVDSRDIAPTVFDVLGGEASVGTRGRSLKGLDSLPPRSRLDVESYSGPIEPPWKDVRRKFRAAVAMRNATFSGGELFAVGGHRDLLGRRPGQVEGLTPIAAEITDPAAYSDVDPSKDFLPSYLRARLLPKKGTTPGDLAVAMNGRIVATARSWPFYVWVTGVNLPNEEFSPGKNDIEFFMIDPVRNRPTE